MMLKYFVFFLCLFNASLAFAQAANLTDAKYLAVLKVVTDHKMGDAEIKPDLEKLREHQRFKKDLQKMVGKLDNSRPSEATNRKIMRILQKAGKDIYNELK